MISRLSPLACVVSAGVLAFSGLDCWGWFLVAAVVLEAST